jgi:hypothetical protein
VARRLAFAFYAGDTGSRDRTHFAPESAILGNGRTRTAVYTECIEQLRGKACTRQVGIRPCYAQSSGRLNDSRLLDRALNPHKHAVHIDLEHVMAIAAVGGVDMIADGHSDLSARLGAHLHLEHPTFRVGVSRIAETSTRTRNLPEGLQKSRHRSTSTGG